MLSPCLLAAHQRVPGAGPRTPCSVLHQQSHFGCWQLRMEGPARCTEPGGGTLRATSVLLDVMPAITARGITLLASDEGFSTRMVPDSWIWEVEAC